MISTSQFSWPTAPMIRSGGFWPSTLMHIATPPRSFGLSSRAPCRPLSSRTVKRRVIGGCGSLCLSSVSATTTRTAQPVRSSPPSAVVPSETMRSPSRRGLAPAQSGTVSRWVEKRRRGPGRVPGRSTMRLPVSVGTGMRLLASSKRIADAGTPTFFKASLTACGDVRLLAGHALDGEEAHEVLLRRSDIDQIRGAAHRLHPFSCASVASQAPGQARGSARPRRARPQQEHPHRHRGSSATRRCRRRSSCRISA